jgi:glycerol uptake facilitator-like aquaporin
MSTPQKYLIEFVGTGLLVYVYLAIDNPLVIGAALALMLLATRNVSNAGFNPAAALAFSVMGRIQPNEMMLFCISQFLGGLVAYQVFKRYKI